MQEIPNKKMSIVGGLLVVIAVVALLWFLFSQEQILKHTSSSVATSTATTTLNIGGVTIEVPPGSSATVDQVGNTSAFGPAPSLDRAVVFPASFPDDAKTLWQQKFVVTKKLITQNAQSASAWLEVGLEWKMIEDYQGARLAWEYVTKLAPSDPIAFGNLGFLYGYYLHDNIKAQQNFTIALHNDPTALYIYQQAFEFYRDVLKDKAKAQALATLGKQATGNAEFFDRLLATL